MSDTQKRFLEALRAAHPSKVLGWRFTPSGILHAAVYRDPGDPISGSWERIYIVQRDGTGVSA